MCLYVNVCVCVYTHIRTHIYLYTNENWESVAEVYTYVCVRAFVCECAYKSISIHKHARTHVYTFTSKCR